MSRTVVVLRWCATCRADVEFEQPECADEHGTDCPEWVCVQCGDAFFVGFGAFATPSAAGSRRRRAPHVA